MASLRQVLVLAIACLCHLSQEQHESSVSAGTRRKPVDYSTIPDIEMEEAPTVVQPTVQRYHLPLHHPSAFSSPFIVSTKSQTLPVVDTRSVNDGRMSFDTRSVNDGRMSFDTRSPVDTMSQTEDSGMSSVSEATTSPTTLPYYYWPQQQHQFNVAPHAGHEGQQKKQEYRPNRLQYSLPVASSSEQTASSSQHVRHASLPIVEPGSSTQEETIATREMLHQPIPDEVGLGTSLLQDMRSLRLAVSDSTSPGEMRLVNTPGEMPVDQYFVDKPLLTSHVASASADSGAFDFYPFRDPSQILDWKIIGTKRAAKCETGDVAKEPLDQNSRTVYLLIRTREDYNVEAHNTPASVDPNARGLMQLSARADGWRRDAQILNMAGPLHSRMQQEATAVLKKAGDPSLRSDRGEKMFVYEATVPQMDTSSNHRDYSDPTYRQRDDTVDRTFTGKRVKFKLFINGRQVDQTLSRKIASPSMSTSTSSSSVPSVQDDKQRGTSPGRWWSKLKSK